GSLATLKSNHRKWTTDETSEIDVPAMVARNPQISSRQIKRESAISRRSVLRILVRYKFHPHHISLHQDLHGKNLTNYVAFCQWAQYEIQMNGTFSSSILFTDINVRCGIVRDQIIEPYFIDGTLTGGKCECFIRNALTTLLENVPLNVHQTMCNYARRARNELYPNR
ncbi:hypothetical protein WH47_12024, partial [Habropoda laboriosa]